MNCKAILFPLTADIAGYGETPGPHFQSRSRMKENVFDVLIYLFENYMDEETEVSPDPDSIRSELLEIGFPHREINRAFDWLIMSISM